MGVEDSCCRAIEAAIKIIGLCPDSVARECFSSFFKLLKGRRKEKREKRKEKRETIYTTHLGLKSQFLHSQMLPSI